MSKARSKGKAPVKDDAIYNTKPKTSPMDCDPDPLLPGGSMDMGGSGVSYSFDPCGSSFSGGGYECGSWGMSDGALFNVSAKGPTCFNIGGEHWYSHDDGTINTEENDTASEIVAEERIRTMMAQDQACASGSSSSKTSDSPQELWDQGKKLREQYPPNMPEALERFKKAAVMGHREAQYEVFRMLQWGIAGEVNKDLAFSMLKRAAFQDHTRAQSELACMYVEGVSCTKNMRRALEMGLKAAAKNDADAMFNVARCYQQGGDGVVVDYEECRRWMERAADLNHPLSVYFLGVAHLEGQGGLPRSTKNALKCFRKHVDLCAKTNSDMMCFNCGFMGKLGPNGLKRCQGCSAAAYCSVGCQRNHYKQRSPFGHKEVCQLHRSGLEKGKKK